MSHGGGKRYKPLEAIEASKFIASNTPAITSLPSVDGPYFAIRKRATIGRGKSYRYG